MNVHAYMAPENQSRNHLASGRRLRDSGRRQPIWSLVHESAAPLRRAVRPIWNHRE